MAFMNFLVLLGRILYSLIFLMTVRSHFGGDSVAYAAAKGIPMPEVLVPVSGFVAFIGALSIILGYKTTWGALLIIIFLLPVTFGMHAFWKETDPMQYQMQMSSFMKNMSMLGAAILIAYFGPGPLSLDNRN
jgi:putative oxidoreductase